MAAATWTAGWLHAAAWGGRSPEQQASAHGCAGCQPRTHETEIHRWLGLILPLSILDLWSHRLAASA
jgi:hypothetical protein